MNKEENEEPLEEEPELDFLITKSISVNECIRVSDGKRFLMVEQSDNLEPWEARALFLGGDEIILRRALQEEDGG